MSFESIPECSAAPKTVGEMISLLQLFPPAARITFYLQPVDEDGDDIGDSIQAQASEVEYYAADDDESDDKAQVIFESNCAALSVPYSPEQKDKLADVIEALRELLEDADRSETQ